MPTKRDIENLLKQLQREDLTPFERREAARSIAHHKIDEAFDEMGDETSFDLTWRTPKNKLCEVRLQYRHKRARLIDEAIRKLLDNRYKRFRDLGSVIEVATGTNTA